MILRLRLQLRAEWPVEWSAGKSERFNFEWPTIEVSCALGMECWVKLFEMVRFFKSCVIHSFKTHLPPSSHSANRPWTATSFLKQILTLMSFCTKGMPGVAESTVFYSEGNLSHGEKVLNRADEGWWIEALPRSSTMICDEPPFPGGLFRSCRIYCFNSLT